MALSRALREYLKKKKKKKKAVKTEESGITPPPPPPRLLPTWLNRVGKIILKKNKFYNLDVWFLYKVCFFFFGLKGLVVSPACSERRRGC